MALITLTVADLDLEAGTYHVGFKAEGTEIDDGQATAAYFTGFYLNTLVNTPDFTAGVVAFGNELIRAVTRDCPHRPHTTNIARMDVILEDKVLETGQFNTTLHAEGGDPTGNSLPTTAQIVGTYMRSLLSDMDFQMKVWAFAEEYVAKNEGAVIANSDYQPKASAA